MAHLTIPETTANATVRSDILHRLRRAIQNKRQGTLIKGLVLLRDSAQLCTAARVKTLIPGEFNWEICDRRRSYGPDLIPSDYHNCLRTTRTVITEFTARDAAGTVFRGVYAEIRITLRYESNGNRAGKRFQWQ